VRTILSQRITSLSLVYNPIASLPGLNRRRHHAVPQLSDASRSPHRSLDRVRSSSTLSEASEFLIIHALTRAPMWSAAGHWRTPDISVRIASDELLDDELVEVVSRGLRMSCLDPRRVTLEIAWTDADRADMLLPNIRRLKQVGIRLSTDAPHNRELDPQVFDEIRLDLGTTLTGVRADGVRRTVDLARQRNQAIVARGVSTGQRLMTALDLGATHVQGALAGTPYADASTYGRSTANGRRRRHAVDVR
jgi:EAL domain-containing protein (putative c-di-GMP-specific phosphodiesterase class I)